MATMSTKNMALSPAAMDLGLGTTLSQSVQDKVVENKKKLKQMQAARQMSPAGMSLLMNPAGNQYG